MVGNGMGRGTTTNDSSEAIGAMAQSKMKRALYKAQDVYGRAADRAKGAGRQADRLINEQTYPAMAVAAAAGLAIGLVLGLTLGGRD